MGLPARIAARRAGMDGALESPRYQPKRLPSLKSALKNPKIKPLDPNTARPIGTKVNRVLDTAKRVLLIGHHPPDGDSIGSLVALGRVLKAKGMRVDMVVDGDIQGAFRKIDGQQQIKTWDQLQRHDHDTVVLVDVAQPHRLVQKKHSDAVLDIIHKADNVLIVDHHKYPTSPKPEDFGIKQEPGKEKRFVTLIDDQADSNTEIIARIAADLDRQAVFWGEHPRFLEEASDAIIAAQRTDTNDFKSPGTSLRALRIAKYLLDKYYANNLTHVDNMLRYALPEKASQFLAEHVPLETKTKNNLKLGVMKCSKKDVKRALDLAQETDDKTVEGDVHGRLWKTLDDSVADTDLSILVLEMDGGIKVSVRSKKADLATEVVEILGVDENGLPRGGGRDGKAAAWIPGGTIEGVSMLIFDGWFASRPKVGR
ncbi:bifunctional oligoribonuclease/PAP phosphatase NrnA [Myxococcota bacterium]